MDKFNSVNIWYRSFPKSLLSQQKCSLQSHLQSHLDYSTGAVQMQMAVAFFATGVRQWTTECHIQDIAKTWSQVHANILDCSVISGLLRKVPMRSFTVERQSASNVASNDDLLIYSRKRGGRKLTEINISWATTEILASFGWGAWCLITCLADRLLITQPCSCSFQPSNHTDLLDNRSTPRMRQDRGQQKNSCVLWHSPLNH